MNTQGLKLNDVVEMKKEHPCATRSNLFKVVRVGADIKMACLGCGHIVMMDRALFNTKIKRIILP